MIVSSSIFGWTQRVSFKKPQWNLYNVDTIGAWHKCPLYGDVRFIESASKNQVNQTKLIILVTAIKVKSRFFQFNGFHDFRNLPQKKRSLKLNFTIPLHWHSANHKRL